MSAARVPQEAAGRPSRSRPVQVDKTKPQNRYAGPYFVTEVSLMRCPAYEDLSLYAREMLRELQSRHDGSNNGLIQMGQEDVMKRLKIAKRQIAVNARKELVDHGFVVVTWNPGGGRKHDGSKLASTFLLTCYDAHLSGLKVAASRDYLNWRGKPRKPPEIAIDAPVLLSERATMQKRSGSIVAPLTNVQPILPKYAGGLSTPSDHHRAHADMSDIPF